MKKLFIILLLLPVFISTAQNITWTDVTSNYSMPTGVKVFSGLDSSIPLKLKYIEVDLNNTDFEMTPELSTPAHARNWATSLGAIAVINGGYFTGSTSFSAVINSTVEARNVASVNRSSLDYPVTRGFFGFNTDGSMAVNWIYHFGNLKSDIYSYSSPNPNIIGTPASVPTQANGIQLNNLLKGMGAGPVLIKNGAIVNTYNEEVFWGSGVQNTGLDPRSAIGYTANKRVILLVADGRQPGVSVGASLPQMAAILNNLGCVEALNLDGGGSSQLATAGAFINTPSESYRLIPSVWAIHKKANLETPSPTSPIDQSSTTSNPVKLLWNMPTALGSTFKLQVATSKDNWNKHVGFTPNTTTNSVVVVNENITTSSYDFSNLILGQTYFWTIVAFKNGNLKSYYSQPLSFTYTNGVEVDWRRASSNSTRPSWFGTDSERGLAYANNKVYVVSRSDATKVRILNSFNGTDIGELSTTGLSGGTFLLNDIEASANGELLGCNLTTTSATSAFKVYRWTTDSAVPEVYINYASASNIRLGDKFTVHGDISKDAVIFAAAGAGTRIVKWLVINGVLQNPTEIVLPVAMGNQPSVTATGTSDLSDLIVNSQARNVILYSNTGVNKGTLSNTIIDSDSNATKYFELDGKKYLAVFQSKQIAGSPLGNNCRIVDITNGFSTATIVATTERLGDLTNANAAGDIDIRTSTSPISLTAITLASNNGVSAKRIFGVVIENGISNNTLSIKQNSVAKNQTINVYANHNNATLTISISDGIDAKCQIDIYSIDGKLIRKESILNSIQNISIDNLSTGIYIVKVRNGSVLYNTKFIKS